MKDAVELRRERHGQHPDRLHDRRHADADARTSSSRSPTAGCPARRDSSRRRSARTASATMLPIEPGKRVVSETTAAELNEMLRGVVADGTGELAQVVGLHGRRQDRHVAQASVRADAAVHGELRRVRAGRVTAARGDRRDRPAGHRATRSTSAERWPRRCSRRSCGTHSATERVPPTGAVSAAASSPGPAAEASTRERTRGTSRQPRPPRLRPRHIPAGIVPKPVP